MVLLASRGGGRAETESGWKWKDRMGGGRGGRTGESGEGLGKKWGGETAAFCRRSRQIIPPAVPPGGPCGPSQ